MSISHIQKNSEKFNHYVKTQYRVSKSIIKFELNLNIVELENGDKIFLKSFQSNKLEEFIEYAKTHELIQINTSDQLEKTVIHATGGGAYKYQKLFD